MGFIACFAFGDSGPEFHVYCASICVIVLLTSLGLRLWKGQLRFISLTEDRPDALQFGIKHIFGWTTAVAVMFGIGRVVYPTLLASNGISGRRWLALMHIAGLGAMISFSVVINIWAMLGHRITSVKIITLLGCVAGAAVINSWILPMETFFFWITVVSQLMMTIALIGLRMNKLRFVK